MATRHLSMPISIEPLAGWRRNPLLAADVSEALGGVNRSRAYWTIPKQTFESDFFVAHNAGVPLVVLEDIAQRSAGGVVPVWFRDPAARFHSQLRVGVGDASRVSWPVPMHNSQAWYPRADGVFINGTSKAAANLLTDNQADVETDTTGLDAFGTCTVAQDDKYQHHGRYSVRARPTGSQSDYGVKLTESAAHMPSAATSDLIQGFAWCFCESAVDARASIRWFDSTPSIISVTAGVKVTLTAGTWEAVTVEGTAPATTAYAQLMMKRDGGPGTDDIWFDCLALSHLTDETSWWIPSACPSVFIASSAPANGAIITAAGQGQAFLPYRLEDEIAESIDGIGNREVRRMKLTEWWGPQ